MNTQSLLNPKHFGRTVFAAVAGLAFSCSAWAATDIQVWYSLNDQNKKVFEQLVKDFNKQNKDAQVKTKSFSSEADLDAALSLTSDKDRPHLVQLSEMSSLDEVAARPYIWPLYQALAKNPVKNAKWFLPAENNFMHDAKGRLLALPLMAEVPVMYYNVEAFKKAGLTPTQPSRAWLSLQEQLVTLANNGSRSCPLTSDQPVSINLENLAAVNKQFYAGSDNQAKAGFNFNTMYIRHLSTMISWVRSEIMVRPSFGPQSPKRFASGECAVFLSNSGNIGEFAAQKKLNFSVSGIPYYPQVTAVPGNPFVTGSGLWLTKGHSAEYDKASTDFIGWLAQTENAAKWYQSTGYLPLTHEAFNATDANYYNSLGEWRNLVAVYGQKPENTTRGFKVNNYHKIRAIFNTTLENALDGKQPAMTALQTAATEANKLIKQK
ncbi:MAG TPA: extracellular solute-binding protein [Alcaligenaceae bacterium]|nr:extracellular solute-binding protein [Alcaligenaceae bacterium]